MAGERIAFPLELATHVPEVLLVRGLVAETLEIDAGFFTNFDYPQAQLAIRDSLIGQQECSLPAVLSTVGREARHIGTPGRGKSMRRAETDYMEALNMQTSSRRLSSRGYRTGSCTKPVGIVIYSAL